MLFPAKLYKKDVIEERHRHRYEVNPEYIPRLEEGGLRFVGRDSTRTRMEVALLDAHPYYVSVQFHPEYLSRPLSPSPPFLGSVYIIEPLYYSDSPIFVKYNNWRCRAFSEIQA